MASYGDAPKLTERIELASEDIQFNDDGYAFYDVGGYGIQHQFKQQILDDHKIVNGLLNFINHCDEMIQSYVSQLEDVKDDDQETFLDSQIDEWGRKKSDLVDLIEYRTKTNFKEFLGKT